MQIFTRPEAVIFPYPLKELGDPQELLFFDIETTGLSASQGQVYLIGALAYEAGEGWVLRQWFADSLADEEAVLCAFFDFASGFTTLIHFNGDSFDIPFLEKCAAQYGIAAPLGRLQSLDLYRLIRPYRKLFPDGRLNQKSMERWLGLTRLDRYTGGELISVYEAYTVSGDAVLCRNLLLHNEEDLTGLPVLLSLLSIPDFFSGSFLRPEAEFSDGLLTLRAEASAALPAPLSLSAPDIALSAEGSLLTLRISAETGEMSHWFPDYMNYYYLPGEDCCVHKSVGEFVDRACRQRATARTAFVRFTGTFIPVFRVPDQAAPVFRREFRDKAAFLELGSFLEALPETKLSYIADALTHLGLRNPDRARSDKETERNGA